MNITQTSLPELDWASEPASQADSTCSRINSDSDVSYHPGMPAASTIRGQKRCSSETRTTIAPPKAKRRKTVPISASPQAHTLQRVTYECIDSDNEDHVDVEVLSVDNDAADVRVTNHTSARFTSPHSLAWSPWTWNQLDLITSQARDLLREDTVRSKPSIQQAYAFHRYGYLGPTPSKQGPRRELDSDDFMDHLPQVLATIQSEIETLGECLAGLTPEDLPASLALAQQWIRSVDKPPADFVLPPMIDRDILLWCAPVAQLLEQREVFRRLVNSWADGRRMRSRPWSVLTKPLRARAWKATLVRQRHIIHCIWSLAPVAVRNMLLELAHDANHHLFGNDGDADTTSAPSAAPPISFAPSETIHSMSRYAVQCAEIDAMFEDALLESVPLEVYEQQIMSPAPSSSPLAHVFRSSSSPSPSSSSSSSFPSSSSPLAHASHPSSSPSPSSSSFSPSPSSSHSLHQDTLVPSSLSDTVSIHGMESIHDPTSAHDVSRARDPQSSLLTNSATMPVPDPTHCTERTWCTQHAHQLAGVTEALVRQYDMQLRHMREYYEQTRQEEEMTTLALREEFRTQLESEYEERLRQASMATSHHYETQRTAQTLCHEATLASMRADNEATLAGAMHQLSECEAQRIPLETEVVALRSQVAKLLEQSAAHESQAANLNSVFQTLQSLVASTRTLSSCPTQASTTDALPASVSAQVQPPHHHHVAAPQFTSILTTPDTYIMMRTPCDSATLSNHHSVLGIDEQYDSILQGNLSMFSLHSTPLPFQ